MIPFSPPYYDQDILDAVTETIKSGWITTGPRTKEFEKEISNYIGIKKVLCVNAATNGLILGMKWFGIGEDDEVIVPVYTYCASANAILHCGAKPVMV